MDNDLDSTIETIDEPTSTEAAPAVGSPAAKPASAAPAPAGLDPKAFATELAKAMKAPENADKTKAEIKKDLIEELLSGETVDVDKSYVPVLKHFHGSNKEMRQMIEALQKRLDGYEPQIQTAARSAEEQKFIQAAGGAEVHNSAKERALAAAHEILGTDPETYNHMEDEEGGASFAAVANAQYKKFVAEAKAGNAPAKDAGKPVAKQATATRLPSGGQKGTPTADTPAARLAKLRSSSVDFGDI